MAITISISSAPFFIASSVSNTLDSIHCIIKKVCTRCWSSQGKSDNSAHFHLFISIQNTQFLCCQTDISTTHGRITSNTGFTQTALKRYMQACSHNFRISSSVASAYHLILLPIVHLKQSVVDIPSKITHTIRFCVPTKDRKPNYIVIGFMVSSLFRVSTVTCSFGITGCSSVSCSGVASTSGRSSVDTWTW